MKFTAEQIAGNLRRRGSRNPKAEVQQLSKIEEGKRRFFDFFI
jgi:hypothetical protein